MRDPALVEIYEAPIYHLAWGVQLAADDVPSAVAGFLALQSTYGVGRKGTRTYDAPPLAVNYGRNLQQVRAEADSLLVDQHARVDEVLRLGVILDRRALLSAPPRENLFEAFGRIEGGEANDGGSRVRGQLLLVELPGNHLTKLQGDDDLERRGFATGADADRIWVPQCGAVRDLVVLLEDVS